MSSKRPSNAGEVLEESVKAHIEAENVDSFDVLKKVKAPS